MSQDAPVLWFTGLSGAGKTTISKLVKEFLEESGVPVEHLDGDEVRATLSTDLGFSRKDRDLQISRIGWIANLLARNGVVVLVSAISPYQESRDAVISTFQRGLEVFVDAPLEVVEERDTKGLYKKARLGEIRGFTGIDDPYEHPEFPALHLNTGGVSISDSVDEVITLLRKEGVLNGS